MIYVLFVIASGLPALVIAAETQQPRTILEMLFGVKKEPKAPVQPHKKKKKKPANPSKTNDTAAALAIMPKLETASKILVVGDFFTKGIATGLDATFQNSPGIAIEARSTGPAGLARDDLFDWSVLLPGYLDEVKPALIVVSLGANDRQQLKLNGVREKFKSDNWTAEYERRVSALAKIAADRKIPLIWVGLPSFSSPSMTADAITINSIIQAGVSKAGGEFIDIWDGFVDDAGQFIISGSDINGQQVRLRTSDGLGYTDAGKRKVAFYIEKPARKLLGAAAEIGNAVIGQDSLPDLVTLPPVEQTKIVRTPPISLVDPELDGGTTLLGDRVLNASNSKVSIAPVLLTTAPKGRIDDFSMPAKQ